MEEYQHYKKRVMEFPCACNITSEESTNIKLKAILHNLSEAKDILNSESENIRNANMLTWIYFRLKKNTKAVEENNKVLKLTDHKNMATLGNRFYVMWHTGDEIEAKRCLDSLEKMKEEDNFQELLTEAKAEQAYYYSRLGGPENLKMAISLFSEAVTKKPDNYLWKFGLGLTYRRATHANVFCSTTDRMSVANLKKMAAQYLFEVANKADKRLQAMAYAQLVNLRFNNRSGLDPEFDALFSDLTIRQLCEKALEKGPDIPSVLTHCSKYVRSYDVDKSIDLLERSIIIRPKSIAYQYLGKSYIVKAKLLNTKRYVPRTELKGRAGFEIARQTLICFLKTLLLQIVVAIYKLVNYLKKRSQTDQVKWVSERNWDHQDEVNRFRRLNICETSVGYHSTEKPCAFTHETYRRGRVKGRSNTGHNSPGPSLSGPCRGIDRGYMTSTSEEWRQKSKIGMYVSRPTTGSLNKDDDLVKRAKECFTKAIDSKKENFPARLDLGNLLKETGDIQEAVKTFNTLTNDFLSSKNHRLTLISAYEQAGICYLELSKLNPCKGNYETKGKDKLTIAVSLAADLAVMMPELKDTQQLWTAFRTLEKEIDRESPSPRQQKKKIRLLELARNYGQVIEFVQKLREFSEDELNDPDIVTAALNSYLQENQPENALAFQNVIGIRPDIGDWWSTGAVRDLRIKVLLETISGRLKESAENPTILFQQLFKLTLGTCFGICAQEDQLVNPVEGVTGDVLVVYDGDYDSEESPSPTVKSARCLKEIANSLFGLIAEENLKGCPVYGDYEGETQLQEMRRYRVVIIMLGNERRNRHFQAILKRYSQDSTDSSNQRVLLVDTGLTDGHKPELLKQYECFKLEDIGGLGDIAQVPGFMEDDGQLSFADILHHVFHLDVDAVMKLFCFMIGQQWSCPITTVN